MKTFYSTEKDLPAFVRLVLGLPWIPLERLTEGLDLVEAAANVLTGRQHDFALDMIEYVRATWINGVFPPSSWNMFEHR